MANDDRRGSQVGSIVSIVIGVALIATLNPMAMISGALMIAGGGFGIAQSLNTSSASAVRSKDIEFTSAAEGISVPVVFGRQKVVGNIIGGDKAQFRSAPIKGKKPKSLFGLGGGSRPIIGYRYFWSWEVGLCHGSVDEIEQVYSMPGEIEMIADKTSIRVAEPYTGPALGHISTTDEEKGYNNHASGPITIVVDTAANLSLNLEVIFSNVPVAYTVTNIAGLNITFTPVTTTDLKFSLPRYSAIYPKIPNVGGTVRLRFASTSGLTVGDTVTIPGSGKFTVTTIYDSLDATLTVVSALNQGYILASEHVYVHVSTTTEFDADYEELTLNSPATEVVYGLSMASRGEESGTVRVYRGNATQTRVSTNDPYYSSGMNYRYLCWALFMDFQIGQMPAPKTYAFVVRRLPVVELDDGTDLTGSGFKVRGSADTSKAAYTEANPAAIAWEVLTNKMWGRGISSDYLDSASFISASEYFEDRHIGMSLTLDSQVRVTEFLDGLLSQVKSALIWDNETLKFRVLLDPQQTHATIRTFRRSEVSDMSFSRPDWGSTINQVRAEYNARDRNYRPSVVVAHNLANYNVVGIINPHKISLNAFSDHDAALEQATRILHEMSYPVGQLSFEINRFGCDLEPGSVFRLIWDEWSDSIVTGYFVVTGIEPGSSSREAIRITAVEDPALGFVDGEETSTSIPGTQPWERLRDNAIDQGGTYSEPDETLQSIFPVKAFELPAIMTMGKQNLLLLTGEQSSTAIDAIAARWALDETTEEFNELGSLATFSLTGKLLTDYDAGPLLDRTAAGFQFSLTSASTLNEAALLRTATVSANTDDFEDLIETEKYVMLIGEELMQIGLIEKLGANQYRARNIIRGIWGSPIQNHYNLESIFFFEELPDEVFDADTLPTNKEIPFRAYPNTPHGEKEVGDNIYVERDNTATDRLFLGEGTLPLAPEPVSITVDGDVLTIVVRPRFADKGAGIDSLAQSLSKPISDIGAMSFVIGLYDATGALMTRKAAVSMVDNELALGIDGDTTFADPEALGYWIPDNLNDPDYGVVKIEFQVPYGVNAANVVQARVFSSLEGRESVKPAIFQI